MCPMEGIISELIDLNKMSYYNNYIFFLKTEIVRAMNYVISQGWSMYWGTARWSPVEVNFYDLV